MSGISLHEAVFEYVDALREGNVPEGTIKTYRNVLLRLYRKFPDRQFAGIKTKDLSAFLYGPGGILVGKSTNTGATYRAALNSFFRYGQMRDWTKHVTIVPMPVIRPRGNGARRALATRLNKTQLRLLFNSCKDPVLRGMLAVGISTALRVSDIVKIKVGDIDLSNGDLFVWSKKTRKYDAKPITLDLEEELRVYLKWYTDTAGVTVVDGDSFLFPGWRRVGNNEFVADPSWHTSYSWAQTRLNALFEGCGIQVESGECWHVIRRSVARIYFDGLREQISYDHALRQTSALLDHDLSTTTEGYLGLQAEREARDKSLRGQRFISLAPDTSVVPLQGREARGRSHP